MSMKYRQLSLNDTFSDCQELVAYYRVIMNLL